MKKFKNKNPYNQYIDSSFIVLLSKAILENFPGWLADALVYKNIGYEPCDDCNQKYFDCCCEGSRVNLDKPCEECGYNYCLCDYKIDKNYQSYSEDNKNQDLYLGPIAIKTAKEYLSKDQLVELATLLYKEKYFDISEEVVADYINTINEIMKNK